MHEYALADCCHKRLLENGADGHMLESWTLRYQHRILHDIITLCTPRRAGLGAAGQLHGSKVLESPAAGTPCMCHMPVPGQAAGPLVPYRHL